MLPEEYSSDMKYADLPFSFNCPEQGSEGYINPAFSPGVGPIQDQSKNPYYIKRNKERQEIHDRILELSRSAEQERTKE